MAIQPQNPEFRNNPENFHPCIPAPVLLNLLTQCKSDKVLSIM